MSGWIKFEKSLETDPRTLRVAKALADRIVLFDTGDPRHRSDTFDPCNALAFHYVTLVCGALARLWIFADSHARDDDTLDMSAAEVDEWLGLPGFCSLLPPDWLIELDDGRVELPGFQAHNGVEAKKRALTQKRVERHRKAQCNAPALQDNKSRNAPALPDQTRPDQTNTRQKNPTGPAAPPKPDPVADTLARLKAIYPRRAGSQRWPDAEKALRARLKEGFTPQQILDGATRYAAFITACGKAGTGYVQQVATFLGTGKGFTEEWTPPATTGPARRLTKFEQLTAGLGLDAGEEAAA